MVKPKPQRAQTEARPSSASEMDAEHHANALQKVTEKGGTWRPVRELVRELSDGREAVRCDAVAPASGSRIPDQRHQSEEEQSFRAAYLRLWTGHQNNGG
ncbi:hypothetical protein NDU88_009593 [Pleurodeles waltl]|uniref:Uncharacterized protein n=1 Tax=Pleurodeles waltl TaxID=8319 RepID=A0AAV7RVN4_PLEWA|nr:hypothetical protein NDU88_009593 [Pleurodeles waltl]